MNRLTLLFLFTALISFTRSQTVYELKRDGCPSHIGKYISIYIDESTKATIDEISSSKTSSQFTNSAEEVLNFNISKSAIWCKIKFTASQAADWLLEYQSPSNNRIDLFVFKHNKLICTQHSGIPYPKSERKILGGHILFDLDIYPNDTLECYLRSLGSGPMVISLRASDAHAFFNEDHNLNLLHGMFYGIMFLMVLYNLFLYFTSYDKVYIYYILYIFFSTLFIAFFMGYIFFLPDLFLGIFNRMPVLVPSMFGFFGLLFTMQFLNTKTLAPKLHKAMMVFMMLVLLPIILAIIGFPHESVAIIQVFGIILAILSFSTGITVYRKGYRPAKFYIIGFGAYMIGLVILIVANAIHLSLGGLETYALECGSAIEAIMLSFAIGDKLNTANRDKQLAQTQAFEALKENEKLIREQNLVLERKVKERTIELEQAKDIVEEKNKEITDSIRYAKRIQIHLLPSSKYIEKNMERLKDEKNKN
jgi:hypothetical protein